MSPKRLLIVICLLPFATVIAQAQASHTCPNGPSTVGNCSSSGGSGGGSGGGLFGIFNPGPPKPSAAQLKQQRLAAEAYALDVQGVAAANRKDWAAAANYYRAALAKTPGDVVIRQNLGNAESYLGQDAYNRQDWKTALDLLQDAARNNPTAPYYPQWAQAAEQQYQAFLAQQASQRQAQQQAAIDAANNAAALERQRQAAAAIAAQQQQDKMVADGVQQTMRDFLQTLDANYDQFRLGSNSATPGAGNQNSSAPGSGRAGLTFISPATAAPALAATQPAASGGAPSAATPASTGNAQGLQFIPSGETRDAPAPVKTAAAPVQASAGGNGGGGGGNTPLEFMPPAVSTSTPTGTAPVAQGGNPPPPGLPAQQLAAPQSVTPNVQFDQTGQPSGGAAGNGLVFTPANPAAAMPTAAAPPQPAGQPQPRPPTPQRQTTFERPDSTTVDVRGAQAPLALRPDNLKEPAPNPIPAAAAATNPLQLPEESDLRFLFPEEESKWPGPKDPGFPLINPLREAATYQKQLKQEDDWALATTLSVRRPPGGPSVADGMQEDLLHGQAVQQYAPELFDRYQRDTNFHNYVNLMLGYADDLAVGEYFQGIADAHKAGIVGYRDRLKKLEDAKILEPGMGIPDQESRHPELIQVVNDAAAAADKDEQAQLAKARANDGPILDRYYRLEFGIIGQKAAADSK